MRAYSRASSPGYSPTVACESYMLLSSRSIRRGNPLFQPEFFPPREAESVRKVLTDDLRAWLRCRRKVDPGNWGGGNTGEAEVTAKKDDEEIEDTHIKLLTRIHKTSDLETLCIMARRVSHFVSIISPLSPEAGAILFQFRWEFVLSVKKKVYSFVWKV